jgi:hypothetical protein
MKAKPSGKLRDGAQCKVIGGVHAGKSGIVTDINTSKTGHVDYRGATRRRAIQNSRKKCRHLTGSCLGTRVLANRLPQIRVSVGFEYGN